VFTLTVWWLVAALVPLLAWAWLAGLHGGFWRADQRLPKTAARQAHWPSVAIVVPARNEAEVIRLSLQTLLTQDYPGPFHVFLVDDASEDGTATIAREAAAATPDRLTIVDAPPLPSGWVGKMNAVEAGVRAATDWQEGPDYLLLTDADVAHGRAQLRRLVSQAERNDLVLTSLMVMLWCRRPVERLLIPAFVFFFQMLFPFRRVNDPRHPTAAAAGGCMLVRRAALEDSGGIAAIRTALIDDCALAAQLKKQGNIWLGLSGKAASVRPYDTLGEIWRMVRRTAYTQLRYNPAYLAGTVIGMLILFLGPPAVLVAALSVGALIPAAIALVTWLAIGLLYRPTARLYGLSPPWWFSLPLAGVLYTAMTLDSARMHCRREAGAWKGRTYDARSGD